MSSRRADQEWTGEPDHVSHMSVTGNIGSLVEATRYPACASGPALAIGRNTTGLFAV